ncbi:hypothetical protein SESBI_46200 [Sesbania bispinosa]|nr:hypothetical protein SESBI_46200 [Sesbania bispinosa]
MEEDEDLFEIDLDAVPLPPPHYWESYFTSTGNIALLANCLLPTSHISSAIPACKAGNTNNVLLITEPTSLREYLRLPFLGFMDYEKMKAQFHFQFQR